MNLPGRRVIIAIYQAVVPHDLDWPSGPLPLAQGKIRADTATRSTYYPPRTARLLYGGPEHTRRWHKKVKVRAGTATIVALEAIRVSDHSGALLVHVIPDDIRNAVRELGGRNNGALNGFDAQSLAPELAISSARPYTLAFMTAARRLPRLYSVLRYPRWAPINQWLWSLASRTNEEDYPPDPMQVARQDQDRIRFSADWSGMVLRDGMALVGARPDRGSDDPYYGSAFLYARTIYADVVALGLLQLQGITALEEDLARITDSPGDSSAMEDLGLKLAFFRQRLWWQHLTTHGVPNQMLNAFHSQHQLPTRFDQILAEVSDYNRLIRDDQERDVNSGAVILTVLTVPVGIGLATLQLIGHPAAGEVIGVMGACLLVSLAILLSRPGRIAVNSVRRRLSPEK